MSKKSRGTNAERDLIHKFWAADWAAMRSPGSGSTKYPCPDIIASNNVRKLVIEAKLTTEERKYFRSDEIKDLQIFSDKFGAEPWVAIKFYGIPWFFLTLEDLESSGKNFVVSKEVGERRGLSFEELISM